MVGVQQILQNDDTIEQVILYFSGNTRMYVKLYLSALFLYFVFALQTGVAQLMIKLYYFWSPIIKTIKNGLELPASPVPFDRLGGDAKMA